MPEPLYCGFCYQEIPNNLIRDLEDKRPAIKAKDSVLLPGCEPVEDEFAMTHRNLAYLGCPTCLKAVPMPEKVKRTSKYSQMSFDVPMVEIP